MTGWLGDWVTEWLGDWVLYVRARLHAADRYSNIMAGGGGYEYDDSSALSWPWKKWAVCLSQVKIIRSPPVTSTRTRPTWKLRPNIRSRRRRRVCNFTISPMPSMRRWIFSSFEKTDYNREADAGTRIRASSSFQPPFRRAKCRYGISRPLFLFASRLMYLYATIFFLAMAMFRALQTANIGSPSRLRYRFTFI